MRRTRVRALFYPDGKDPVAGELLRNPRLAEMLTSLAKANSVEPFYRGDIARIIADGFRKNGGLVTSEDMAAYEARLVEPLTMAWGEHAIHTAPLTAGGLSVLQMLRALQALDWEHMPAGLARTHARLEAMRLAWRDRLSLLGDPEFVEVPVARLLSADYARESADRITTAVKAGRFLADSGTPRPESGTIHLSAADRQGNFVALTLSHGNGFGACVTVEELGLTLGHGMSRSTRVPATQTRPDRASARCITWSPRLSRAEVDRCSRSAEPAAERSPMGCWKCSLNSSCSANRSPSHSLPPACTPRGTRPCSSRSTGPQPSQSN